MKRFEHGLRVPFRDAEEGTRRPFRVTMPLLPILQRPRADADQGGKLILREPQFFAHHPRIRRFERNLARGLLFAREDRPALFEALRKLLEEFVFHGYSVSIMDFRILI